MTTSTTLSGDGSGTAAGFVGSLAHTPLAEVLRRIVVEELSGDLQITTPKAIKTIYFDRGFVVFASSNIKGDRLGERMIEAGRISRHEFALASMLMKSTKKKFGKVLVEAGIVAEEELGRHVAAQVNRIVLSLFSAKRGMYSFDERPCTIPVDLMVSLSVYRIALEGIRRMSSKKLVLSGLPAPETRVRVVDQPPFTLNVDKLRRDEKAVLRAANQGASVKDIVDVVGGNDGVVLRACYGLLSGGILEAVEPDERSQILRVQEETGTFVLSEIRRKAGVADEPELEPPSAPPRMTEPAETPRAIAREDAAQNMPEQEDTGIFAWARRLWSALRGWFARFDRAAEEPLGVQPSEVKSTPTPRAELPVVTARPAPARDTPPVAKPPKVESVGVPSWSMKDGAEDAPDTAPDAEVGSVGAPSWSLKSDEVSESPIERLGAPSWSMKDDPAEEDVETSAPTRPAAAKFEPPSWSIMDVPEESEAEEPLVTMDSELFIAGDIPGDDEPSMMSQVPVEEIELDEESLRIEVEVEVEVEAEEEALSEPTEREVKERPAPSASAPTDRPRADYEPEAEPERTTHEQQMRRMKQSGGEERLLRDVKLHFRMRDFQGAIPLLEQLVAISPGKAFYRGMLGRAMARHPATRKNAEEHFIEALRLSPQDPELHYWLGLYYKSFGLKSRAITEFRTTLRINPKHEGARKQLTGGGKKDDVLGNVMKKLFG